MQTLLIVIHVLVSLFMILVILLQAGRGGGLSGLAGGSSSVFGGRGSQTFLGKITTACAAVFMLTSLVLAYFSTPETSLVPLVPEEPAGVVAPQQNGADSDSGEAPADAEQAPAPGTDGASAPESEQE